MKDAVDMEDEEDEEEEYEDVATAEDGTDAEGDSEDESEEDEDEEDEEEEDEDAESNDGESTSSDTVLHWQWEQGQDIFYIHQEGDPERKLCNTVLAASCSCLSTLLADSQESLANAISASGLSFDPGGQRSLESISFEAV